jgi:hypothetical protein
MHFLGGLWVGFIFIYIFQPKSASLRTIFQAMVFVLAVGLVWEVYEVLVNDVIAKNPLDIPDTVSDICFDLSGGSCAMLYLWKKLEKKQLK